MEDLIPSNSNIKFKRFTSTLVQYKKHQSVIKFTLSLLNGFKTMRKHSSLIFILGLISLSSMAQAASCLNSTGTTLSTSDVQVTSIGGIEQTPGIDSDVCSFREGIKKDQSSGIEGINYNDLNDFSSNANFLEDLFEITDSSNLINWGLVVDSSNTVNQTTGTWTYSGTEDLSSPFVVVLKSSISYAAYLFNNLEDVDGGSFVINFLNASGNAIGEISHLSIYKATGDFTDTILDGPNPVPLPAALWLFAPALLGFMGFRRKNKA